MTPDPRNYAAHIATVLACILQAGPRGAKLLHAKILALYETFGVLAGGLRFPTLHDLYEAIRGDRRANPQARQSIVDALAPILLAIGNVLAYRQGWETRALAQRSIAYELAGVSHACQDLLVNYLVLGEFVRRIEQGMSNYEVKRKKVN